MEPDSCRPSESSRKRGPGRRLGPAIGRNVVDSTENRKLVRGGRFAEGYPCQLRDNAGGRGCAIDEVEIQSRLELLYSKASSRDRSENLRDVRRSELGSV